MSSQQPAPLALAWCGATTPPSPWAYGAAGKAARHRRSLRQIKKGAFFLFFGRATEAALRAAEKAPRAAETALRAAETARRTSLYGLGKPLAGRTHRRSCLPECHTDADMAPRFASRRTPHTPPRR